MIARDARAELLAIYRAALSAVEPGHVLGRALRIADGALEIAGSRVAPHSRIFVLAIGKAGAALAAEAERIAGDRIAAGIALVPDGGERSLAHCELQVGAHPVSDARGAAATRAILSFVAQPGPDDVLLVLLSGGGSSLLCAPAPGLALADFAETVRVLLAGGASIDELNAVRKHLSAATGGRLARATRAGRIEVLVISDVMDDRLDVIASGPFTPDRSRYGDAVAVLAQRDPGRRIPAAVRAHLECGARGERDETPKPGDPAFERTRHVVIANNATALEAAGRAAKARGWRTMTVNTGLFGEARLAAQRLIQFESWGRAHQPHCVIAGGETTVTVRGAGRGGRSQELALAAALAIEGRDDIALLAAGTDGVDGPTDAAGAFVDGDTIERGRLAGVDAAAALADNDAYGFFTREGGLIRTGPTGTNVADLAFVLRDPGR